MRRDTASSRPAGGITRAVRISTSGRHAGWNRGIPGLPVPAAPQPSQPAHRSGTQADPGHAPQEPHLGMVELWHRLRQRSYTRRPESLFRVMRKLGLFPQAEKKPVYKPKPYEQMTYQATGTGRCEGSAPQVYCRPGASPVPIYGY